MVDVAWLGEAMEKAGFKYQKDLAEAAGISASTVGNALKRGEVRESTAEKLQRACGEHAIGPYMDTDRIEGKRRKESVAIPPDMDPEGCVERFEGDDCFTTSPECVGCWGRLLTLDEVEDLPFNRAACRLEHGWKMSGGYLVYVDSDGREIDAEEILKIKNKTN